MNFFVFIRIVHKNVPGLIIKNKYFQTNYQEVELLLRLITLKECIRVLLKILALYNDQLELKKKSIYFYLTK